MPATWPEKYHSAPKKHTAQISSQAQTARKIAASAALRTRSGRFSPSAREITALRPTALPRPRDDAISCTGPARVRAAMASSPSLATKILSTVL